MKYSPFTFTVLSLIFAVSCESNREIDKQTLSTTNIQSRTSSDATGARTSVAKTPRIKSAVTASKYTAPDTLLVETASSFEAYDAILRHDTLLIISPSKSAFYPLGEVKHATDLATRAPKFAAEVGNTIQSDGQPYTYTVLRYKRSAIKFYDDEEFGATIVAGIVADPEIELPNAVRIGQSLSQVLSALFSKFPTEKASSIRVVRIDSALNGVMSYYNFDDAVLQKVFFDSYSIMDKRI